jgi:hypothetical protein
MVAFDSEFYFPVYDLRTLHHNSWVKLLMLLAPHGSQAFEYCTRIFPIREFHLYQSGKGQVILCSSDKVIDGSFDLIITIFQ